MTNPVQINTNAQLRSGMEDEPIISNVSFSHQGPCRVNTTSSSNGVDFNCNESSHVIKPALLDELEREIDRQLKAKTKKRQLASKNVKSQSKSVSHNHDVLGDEKDCNSSETEQNEPCNPKLTRSKMRELLAKELTPNVCNLLPKPWKSDIADLITKDLSDDSSDEEYHPKVEMSDDETMLDESSFFNKKMLETCKIQLQGEQQPTSLSLMTQSEKENIGQRTRSKYSLSETALETIEQAFIPPDITTDMYNTECESQDWLDFLKEFTQPLHESQSHENNDDENDPEYNFKIDEEQQEDIEELRADRAVKVSKKELNALMNELCEYAHMLRSDDEDESTSQSRKEQIKGSISDAISVFKQMKRDRTTGSTEKDIGNISNKKHCEAGSQVTVMKQETLLDRDGNQKDEFCEQRIGINNSDEDLILNSESDGKQLNSAPANSTGLDPVKIIMSYMLNNQKLLLLQQMMQHVQLALTNFLLTHGHPFINEEYATSFRQMSMHWIESPYTEIDECFSKFLKNALEVMERWIIIIRSLVHKEEIRRFITSEVEIVNEYRRKKKLYKPALPPLLINVCRKTAFMYPLLLPINGFIPNPNPSTCITPSEINLIVYAWDEYKHLSGKCDIANPKDFSKMINYMVRHKICSWSKTTLSNHIRRAINSPSTNTIKSYYLTNLTPKVSHFLIDIPDKLLPLYKQPPELLEDVWESVLLKKKK